MELMKGVKWAEVSRLLFVKFMTSNSGMKIPREEVGELIW